MAEIFKPKPSSPPPGNQQPLWVWLRANFFSSPFSVVMTIACVYLIYITVPPALNWAIFNASWAGADRSVCDANNEIASGACWVALRVRFWQVMLGPYFGAADNAAEIWRPLAVFALFGVLTFTLLWDGASAWVNKTYVAVFAFLFFPLIAYGLIHGAWFGLPVAPTSQWGGFMLTLILAVGGIVLALPLGILFALGRRSRLPAIRFLSVVYIEFWRANPLITLLFMASNLLPLFFPAGVEFDKVMRALFAITLFQSAYTAEAIRGGLAAIPRGQYEAAASLGMGYAHAIGLIVLPQALKISIPSIVNTFIALFKDTTLVTAISLLDLYGMARNVARSLEWRGFDYEVYIFSALLFFICCYGMSQYSRILEKKLDTGHKS